MTSKLREIATVVSASRPIQSRFEGEFPIEPADVRIDTSADRQGISITGSEDQVSSLTDELPKRVDTFRWTDSTPEGAIFDGTVIEDAGGGAVIDLGDRNGYLPYANVEEFIDSGDRVRVQVRDPIPPWQQSRPLLDARIRSKGTICTLVRDASTSVIETPEGAEELANITNLVDVDIPDGWGIKMEADAKSASIETIQEAVRRHIGRAEEFETTMKEPSRGEPGTLASPLTTTWLWFGRDSRFMWDEAREDIVHTIPGHHRIKAGDSTASRAIDFVEALEVERESFPSEAVFDTFGPTVDDEVAIRHGKPDGQCYSLGDAEVAD
ncbi:MAG: RNA-binding protein, partial [Halobacteriaceae archaeon]